MTAHCVLRKGGGVMTAELQNIGDTTAKLVMVVGVGPLVLSGRWWMDAGANDAGNAQNGSRGNRAEVCGG